MNGMNDADSLCQCGREGLDRTGVRGRAADGAGRWRAGRGRGEQPFGHRQRTGHGGIAGRAPVV